MKNKSAKILACVLLCVLSYSGYSQTGPRKFYELEIVDTTSSSLDVFAAPSINDFGDVAFSGRRTPGGGTVFLSKIGQPTVDLMPGFSSSPQNFVAGRVQINNLQQVIEHTFLSGTTPPQNILRRIDGVSNFTILAYANGAGTFNDFDQIYPSISINNFGEPVYVTRSGQATTILTTGIRPAFSLLPLPSTGDSIRPMMSDCGSLVARAGGNPTDPIRHYFKDFSEYETIASSLDGFVSLGQSPSVSDLCEIITFYGDLNQAGADAIGTNAGPGIFASIEVDKTKGFRKIVRLAGRLIENIPASGGNDDGYCDPGEACLQAELGFNSAGAPIYFNAFDAAGRVGIAHQSLGAKGLADDIFVVSFLATPNIASDNPLRPFTSQAGLWTLTAEIKNIGGVLRERPAVAVPVIQLGEVVNARTVTAINVYDQIANVRTPGSPAESPGDHRLAFHVQTNNGNMIVRANRNIETPVVFIPGIMGSRLAEVSGSTQTERWPGLGVGLLTGSNFDRLLPSGNANIAATDVIRDIANINGVTVLGEFYKSILQTLSTSGGLREYQVEAKPERRTSAGCDMAQRFNDPRLFVFAYDWRKSNNENAVKLEDYVRCIQRFYPGTKVDLVAHSMGGLLARRYIIGNPTDHDVRKMVTIATPFLGAPRSLETIETGRIRFLPDFLDRRVPTFVTRRVKALATESPAVHELFPSQGYFDLGGRPFIEESFDINGDGVVPQIYDYAMTANFFDDRFATLPYNDNEALHGLSGQDDWRLDASGVEFFHIFGERSGRDTVEQIIAKPIARKPLSVTRRDFRIKTRFGFGDRTVPRLSSERIGSFNYNFPEATLRAYVSTNRTQDKLYEHTGLIKSPEVLEQVLTYLDLPFQSLVSNVTGKEGEPMPSFEYKANSGRNLGSLRPPPTESYYVTIEGVERVAISDELGNANTPVGDMGFELSVPGVAYSGGIYGDEVTVGHHGLSMPAGEGEYTVKFRTGSDSVDIEVLKGVGNNEPNLAVRYIDLELPPNVECILTFSPQGVPDLRYDSNNDGTYDTVVAAHVRATGAAALDVTAPAVTVKYSRRTGGGRLITIEAADAESGVGTIYYRVGETGSFRIYTDPFMVSVLTSKVVEAFADDNVGNRSSPVRVVVPAFNQ